MTAARWWTDLIPHPVRAVRRGRPRLDGLVPSVRLVTAAGLVVGAAGVVLLLLAGGGVVALADPGSAGGLETTLLDPVVIGFVTLALTVAGAATARSVVDAPRPRVWMTALVGGIGLLTAVVGLASAAWGLDVAATGVTAWPGPAVALAVSWVGVAAALVIVVAPAGTLAALGDGFVVLAAVPPAAGGLALLVTRATNGSFGILEAGDVGAVGLTTWHLAFAPLYGGFVLWLLVTEIGELAAVAAGRGRSWGRRRLPAAVIVVAKVVVLVVLVFIARVEVADHLGELRWTAWPIAIALAVAAVVALRSGFGFAAVSVERFVWVVGLLAVGAALLVWSPAVLVLLFTLSAVWPGTIGQAVALVAGLGAAVVLLRRIEEGRGIGRLWWVAPVAGGVVAGVATTPLPRLVAGAVAPGAPVFDGLFALGSWLSDSTPATFGLILFLGVVAALVVVGTIRGRRLPVTAGLVLFGWMAVQGVPRVVADLAGAGPVGAWLPTPEAFDLAFTLVVAVLLVAGRSAAVMVPALVTLMVVAYGQLPIPSDRDPWFSIALALPAAAFLLLRIGPLQQSPDRAWTVPALLGWLAASLVILALDVAGGSVAPDVPGIAAVLEVYLTVPAVVVLLAARVPRTIGASPLPSAS